MTPVRLLQPPNNFNPRRSRLSNILQCRGINQSCFKKSKNIKETTRKVHRCPFQNFLAQIFHYDRKTFCCCLPPEVAKNPEKSLNKRKRKKAINHWIQLNSFFPNQFVVITTQTLISQSKKKNFINKKK